MGYRLTRETWLTGGLASLLLCHAAVTLAISGVAPAAFLSLFGAYLHVAAGLWLFTAAVVLLWLRWQDRSVPLPTMIATLARSRWEADRGLSLITPLLIFALLMASFNTFKQRVLPLAGFGMDAPLAALDRALFLGVDPWRVTHALLDSPWASWVIDLSYHAWFAPMALGVMVCAFLPATADRLRYRYLISYALLWLVGGTLLALAMPSAGPCFQSAAIGTVTGFEPLMERLTDQHLQLIDYGVGGLAALGYQQGLLALHGGEELSIGAGISAMPSMHNALAVLFAIAAFQLSRMAGIALSVYAALIWVGSVHLGWHYATDGPVGAAVAWAVWRISAPLADWLLTMPPATATPGYAVGSR